MNRLTEYDKVRGCYVMKPDAPQGEHIQRLGKYEDEAEPMEWILWTDDRKDYAICPVCDYGSEGELLWENRTPHCPYCGKKLEG